ncbi:MAG: NADPH-dependent reductase [Cyanobacteria bacterium RYN_339]|nr:NADPH-dependent reductase [Cyanobacteria bacterium RYN_339]
MAPHIVALAGSLRAGSFNRKLARLGADALARAGASVDLVDLREVMMPLYDGDLEEQEGLPPGAVAFKARLAKAQGLWIACPEYNSSVPGTFKNAIDWASRGDEDVFAGKVVALTGASPGMYGAMRAHYHLRQIVTTLGCWALPEQLLVPRAHEAFGPDGALLNAKSSAMLEELAHALVAATAKLAPG